MPEPAKLNVLLIGGGGREHAIARSISTSPRLANLYVTHPRNPGLAALGKHVDVPVNIKEIYRLEQVCDHNKIDLVIVGPEDPLADGFTDALRGPKRAVFGPTAAGAKLEADKAWAKQFMRSMSIPTAEARSFSNFEGARDYVESRESPMVIKASGLAKGKGVVLPESSVHAVEELDRIMNKRVFGDAGSTVVIEERMTGPEVSVFAVTDGRAISILDVCQDHKRLGEGDTGPNTGGMGAFCPSPLVDAALMARIQSQIIIPTIDGLKREEIDYRGVIYFGLMLTPAGPKVLEYNARFGDPEAQVLLPRITSDALEMFHATATRRLGDIDIDTDPRAAVTVVLASGGYPDTPKTGVPIQGIAAAERERDVIVYHAGTTKASSGEFVTAGGRVIDVTGFGTNVREARERAYAGAAHIKFDGMQMRRDIAASAL